MKKLMLTAIAAATAISAISVLSAPSFADTTADDEPVLNNPVVNRTAKADMLISASSAALKAYNSKVRFEDFDRRYKVRGQGMADKR